MKRFAILLASAAVLSGCVALGASQQDSETTYTLAAIGSDVAIVSGKLSPDAVGTICLADTANYSILTSTRNVADGVNYVPADNAHAKLQRDGSALSSKCVAPLQPG